MPNPESAARGKHMKKVVNVTSPVFCKVGFPTCICSGERGILWLRQAKHGKGTPRMATPGIPMSPRFFLFSPFTPASSCQTAPPLGWGVAASCRQAHRVSLNPGDGLSLVCQRPFELFPLPGRWGVEDGSSHLHHLVRIRGMNILQSQGLGEGGSRSQVTNNTQSLTQRSFLGGHRQVTR